MRPSSPLTTVRHSNLIILNRAYPENTNFGIFIPRNLKFYTFGELHTAKKFNAKTFNLISEVVLELKPPQNTINIKQNAEIVPREVQMNNFLIL